MNDKLTPTRESEVSQQVSMLEKTVEGIVCNLNLLRSRLEPILKPSDIKQTDAEIDTNLVPLAFRIYSCHAKLSGCLQNIQELLEGCEL